MKIKKIDFRNEIRVYFDYTLPSGRTKKEYIAVKLPDSYNSNIFINIPAIGDIQPQDIPEFTKALELARMIASGELEIE